MAPTICLPEISVHNNANSYTRRRRLTVDNNTARINNGIITREQQRIELRRIFNNSLKPERIVPPSPPPSPLWQPACPTDSFSSTRNSNTIDSTNSNNINCSQRWRSILARRQGLLDILARTMALVQRSHILQKRVNALRYETREFIRSVLNNPENNGGRENFIDYKTRGVLSEGNNYVQKTAVSSSSGIIYSARPITPPPTPDSSTENIEVDDIEPRPNDSDHSAYENFSDFESDDSENLQSRKVTQDPMVSSS